MVGGMMMVDKIKADNKTQEAWHFRRGLGQEIISELKALADKPSWFTDILADQVLILGIRKDYLSGRDPRPAPLCPCNRAPARCGARRRGHCQVPSAPRPVQCSTATVASAARLCQRSSAAQKP